MDSKVVSGFVSKGCIVWTMTTIGYTKYTLNLYTWLTTVAKVPWTLCIICCDKESETFFRRENVPYVSWSSGTRRPQVGMAAFGTPAFEKCNHQKLLILEWFARFYSVCGIEHSLYLDGDIVVRRDPWPLLLQEFSDKENMLFQCDCYNETDHVDCGVICSGVVATRHISESQAELYTFDAELWENTAKQDQPFIAKRLELTSTPFKILSRRLFGNGTWQKSGQWLHDDWCLLHYNYLVSSTKKSAMKKSGHWLVIY